MKQQNKERQEMTFEVMDALSMKFDNDKFTVVLDKGTLDALMPQVGKKTSWHASLRYALRNYFIHS